MIPGVFVILALCLVDVSLGQSLGGSGCQYGVKYFESACYAFVNYSMTWPDAQSTCRVLGGSLVEIYNSRENYYVQQMGVDKNVKEGIWLGGHDLITEGQWSWLTIGRPISRYYTDWAPSQPNNYQGNQSCLAMNFEIFTGRWNDEECDKKLPFVCKQAVANIFGR